MVKRPSIRHWLRLRLPNDYRMLLISIGIAFVFWLFLKMSKTYDHEIPVSIRIEKEEDRALLTVPPNQITAHLTSTGWRLLSVALQQSNPQVYIKLKKEDENRIITQQELIRRVRNQLPGGYFDISMQPAELRLRQETALSKKVPIHARQVIKTADGYRLIYPARLQPDSVTITGPISLVETLQSWQTDSLVRTGLTESQQLELKLMQPPPELQLEPERINVDISVEHTTQQQIQLPIRVHYQGADSVQLVPTMATVSFSVGISQFEQVQQDSFLVLLDLDKYPPKPGSKTAPLTLKHHPSYVTVVDFSPKSVTYYLKKH